MRRDLVTLAVGFVHNGPQLLQSERRYVVQDAVLADAIAAIGIHLDPVGDMHELFAHRLAAVFRPVYDLAPVTGRNVGRVSSRRAGAAKALARPTAGWPRPGLRQL